MADLTTFYGYKTQFVFSIENNGQNPIEVETITLLNSNDILTQNIYNEIENSLPINIAGNGSIDAVTNQYSLNRSDITYDATFEILYNVIDMTDFTTVIDTTAVMVEFILENKNIIDSDYYNMLRKLNKHYKLGPNFDPDSTFTTNSFTSTGYPLIKFEDKVKFHLFVMRYKPQFAVFNHMSLGSTIICGAFQYNNDTNSIEAYFTQDEKDAMKGLVFNNIYLFYSEQ